MGEDCRETCAELNRALASLELSMQDTQLAVRERAMYARGLRYYERLYWYAYHHPFRFFFTALFHKKWGKVVEKAQTKKGDKNESND